MADTNIGKMTKGQLRVYINKVLLGVHGSVISASTVLSHDGYIDGNLIVKDSVTVEVSDGKTVTILDTTDII
jgi:hypothetical protein